jgi:aerobic-type carbon monoxide dehydrogenase small subunit (CoxS/CutS family)
MSEETKKTPRTVSRREFLRDAGIVVGGTAVSSAFFLSACGKEVEVTKTVTTTAPGSTVTTTAPGTTSTITKTAADNTVTVTKYTCPVCNQEFDSLEALKAHYDSAHVNGGTAGQKTINFFVNGEACNVQIDPQETLHEVIRNKVGYLSLKEMCTGYGACGSCSIIMDGRPVLSCMILAIECEGKVLETAEGVALSKPELIEAYVDNHCMQCGYCTPGFLVTAKALLDHKSNPTDAEIKEALAGNICRCGSYPQHVLAVKDIS